MTQELIRIMRLLVVIKLTGRGCIWQRQK